MDTENIPPTHSPAAPITPAKKGQTPWGVLIAIVLILIIVVFGAYYAFTERIAPPPATTGTASASL